ncbi:MAG TPA: hypothetical protein PK488_04750, partial [Bacillota bacterium]|nr:hypothetical protein [Bacillota bacterium]
LSPDDVVSTDMTAYLSHPSLLNSVTVLISTPGASKYDLDASMPVAAEQAIGRQSMRKTARNNLPGCLGGMDIGRSFSML